mgnify:CR=1 FL=1
MSLGEHYVSRNLIQRGLKRKIEIPKIKYGVHGICVIYAEFGNLRNLPELFVFFRQFNNCVNYKYRHGAAALPVCIGYVRNRLVPFSEKGKVF